MLRGGIALAKRGLRLPRGIQHESALKEGLDMLFKEFGSPEKPTVILLHGAGLSW